MIIRGKFTEKLIDVFKYEINFDNIKNNIVIKFTDVPFKHMIVLVKDPTKKVRGVYNFETYTNINSIGRTFENSTNLSVAGDLPNGIWEIFVMKTFHSEDNFSFEVEKDILIEPENFYIPEKTLENNKKWYRGELHCHSTYSDGDMNLQEILHAIDSMNLDYFYISDHNTTWTKLQPNKKIYSNHELTFDNLGHINFLGLTEFIDYSEFIKENLSLSEIINNILFFIKNNNKYKNIVISINHPFHKIPFIHNVNMNFIDLIEVINAPFNPTKNKDRLFSFNALDFLWLNGYKIWGVGGSDTHLKTFNDEITIGSPSNFTFSKSNSSEDILENIKKGHNYVTTIGEIKISISDVLGNEYLPGDEIKNNFIINIVANATLKWQAIKNGKIIFESTGEIFEYNDKLKEKEFLRVLGLDKNNFPAVFINPIYNGDIEKKDLMWEDVLKVFNE